VCVGHQKKIQLDFSLVMKKSLTIITSIGSTGGFEKAIEIIKRHQFNVAKLITKIVSLDEVEHLFAKNVDDRKDIKTLIDLK
jgi:threonine dehydrogenase-like Zn-dependent dehydrogenase